ncbi:MAG: protein kinase [Acidobacteriota bacterium]
MSLSAGGRLGPYEIVAPLGAGGMGEVWKAKDTRLDRFVAIKVLPAQLAKDAELLARFEREAKSVAALNHPNILALHDIGKQDDLTYAVMELLEGESLRARLASGPLPSRKAIELAIQMARGLAAAHENGIVHRDLKPDNIWITKDGRLKLLDFGLAKQLLQSAAGLDSQRPTEAITSGDSNTTEKGMILGTVGYMSPEQVRGEVVDARSDLFAFGAVLYEMLTGARAFARNSATETLAAILRDEPPEPGASGRSIPIGLQRIIHHCLEKSADQRFRSAHDVAFALENLGSGADSAVPFTAPFAPENRRTSWKWAGLVAFFTVGMALVGWFLRGGQVPEPTFHRLTFQRGTMENARFAPDGKTVLYSARWKGEPPTLYSIHEGSVESQRLNLDSASLLAVSKDNELAILLNPLQTYGLYPGQLARVPASGGGAREISPNVFAADCDPSTGELATVSVTNSRWRLESPPGTLLREGSGIDFPRFAPRGGTIAFFENRYGLGWPLLPRPGEILVLERGGNPRVLARDRRCTGLAWSARGDEIWFTEWIDGSRTTLFAVSLAGKVRAIWSGPGDLVLQDIAPDGRVLIQDRQLQDGVVALEQGATRERDLSIFDGTTAMDITPDRRALLVNERGGGGGPEGSVFLRPLDGSPPTKLAKGRSEGLSPDGKLVLVWDANQRDRFSLVPTGVGQTTSIDLAGIENGQLAKFMPNGKGFVFQGVDKAGEIRLYLVDIEKRGAPKPLTPEKSLVWQGGNPISPDGRFVFELRDTDRARVDEVTSIEDGSSRPIPGKEARDIPIRWTADGRGIYVFKREGLPVRVFRLDLETGTKLLVKEFMPADPGGITGMSSVTMTADATVFAFNYRRRLSELFLVDGLK